ncbi:MAG: FAD binding domain-containing protein [Desulfobacterales bacterium]|nr:FAD binding domain-containing protein [Desulfobacterales bacterium]
MKLPNFDYVKFDSLSKSCEVLEAHGPKAVPVAGGTDLMIALKNRLKTPEVIVDLGGVPGLDQITDAGSEGLKIGPMVTLRHLASHPLIIEKIPVLARAALDVGSIQLQTMGTIGGNLCQDNCCLYYNRPPMLRQTAGPCYKLGGDACHAVRGSKNCWATYCGDIAPVLLALHARVKIAGPRAETVMAAGQLFSGDGTKPQTLTAGRLIAEIQVPAQPAYSGSAYLKMRVRKAIDYPLLGVAVHLALKNDAQTIDHISLAMTAVDKAPVLVEAAGELAGQKLSDERLEHLAEAAYKKAAPINNVSGYTPGYRKNMARVYVRSAVRQALATATGKGGNN